MASALAPDGDQVNEHVEPRDDLHHRGDEEPPALLAVPGDEVQHGGGEAQAVSETDRSTVSKWLDTAAKILKVIEKLRSINWF